MQIPATLPGQPLGVQWSWLDSLFSSKDLNQEDKVHLLGDLQNLSTTYDKPPLDQALQLLEFWLQMNEDSLEVTFMREREKWIQDYSGRDQQAFRAIGHQLLAARYWHFDQFSEGLEHYIRAYSIYKKMSPNEFPMKSQFQYDYASQYYYFRDFGSVKDLLREIWETIPEVYVKNKVTSLNTLGLCYGQLAMYDSSSYFFKKAVEYAATDESKVWVGIIQGNLSMNLIQQGRYEEAVPLLESNIASSRKRKAMADLAFALVGLGEIRLLQDKPREALDLIQEGYSILKSKNKLKHFAYQARVYVPLGKALMANGRAEEAFFYLDAGRVAKDSLESQRNALFLSGVQHKLETEQHLAAIRQQETELREQRLLMGGLIFILIGSVAFTIVFFRQKKRIAVEKKRSDDLLLNILPEEVARDLKQKGKVQAQHFEEATILFTDFKGFTRIAETLTPDDLVEDLDHFFRRFDEITRKFGMEKIKTIGDAYMAACGIPVAQPDHAIRAVSAALAIRDMMRNEQSGRASANQQNYEIRIGLHSGPVVAGVIGLHKFSYDIWGDTVNIAARMESSGEAGKVNISSATYDLVKDHFHCAFRGQVAAKNKGEIGMYFIDHLRDHQ